MIELFNQDCMEGMKRYPDKHFDLAIVDPPYGLGLARAIHCTKPDRPSTWAKIEKYERKEWDEEKPPAEYWLELFRVSKEQIVWGGNYFANSLPESRGWIFWDKMFENTTNFSHGELAWTSFYAPLRKYRQSSKDETRGGKDRTHPTQKPVKLYEWLLKNYAKSGDRILDTHLGSGSIAIACDNMGFNLVGFEIDKDYYEGALKRLEEHKRQGKLFHAI